MVQELAILFMQRYIDIFQIYLSISIIFIFYVKLLELFIINDVDNLHQKEKKRRG